VQVLQLAPNDAPLYTIHDLYRTEKSSFGHLIRIRGLVASTTPDSVVLEDRWGSTECLLAQPEHWRVGSAIEVSGFPIADGLGRDLFQAHAVEIPAEEGKQLDEAASSALTTVKSIRTLPTEKAALALPVRITGVITNNDTIWRQLYVQDQTGGIYTKYSGAHPELQPGVLVTVVGITGAGDFAPVIRAPKFQIRGTASLPEPVPVTTDSAASGLLDSQYASVEGVVHPMKFGEQPSHLVLTFQLFAAFGQIHVFTSPGFPDLRQSGKLEDARVRIRGVFGTVFNSHRQLVGYQLLVASPSQIEVLDPPPVPDPFNMEITPIGSLLRFSPGSRSGHRVKVAGVVTMAGTDLLYLQDDSGGVEVRGDASSARVGEWIESVGYPTLEGRYSPVLSDSILRPVSGKRTITPKVTTVESILQGQYDSQLVTVDGRLLTVLQGPGSINLVLRSGIQTFTAQLDTSEFGSHPIKLQDGSQLQLTGVSSAQIDSGKLYRLLLNEPVTFKILLRSPGDIAVVGVAPFWTTQATLVLLALCSLIIVIILA
jgi:hypothetical protein